MFEMLVLLINEINSHRFYLATCFLFIFTSEALPHRGCPTLSFILHIWEFAVAICRKNLPWLFAARICRRSLPQELAVAICRENLPWVFCICKRIFFCIREQILFIWKQTFFTCDQNFLICGVFFINSVSFCYCRGSHGPP